MATRPTGKGLGRGLSALLGEPEHVTEAQSPHHLPIDRIHPNPAQPRRRFDTAELENLAASIRERGVLQPLIVRPDPNGDGWQIVAGERRWRAAQMAQLHDVPVVVRQLDDAAVLEIAIVENIQRADLTPVEEARGYARLIEEFGHTQEKLGDIVGKSRSHIANTLRLLSLPDDVLALLADGRLSAGHARALIGTPNPALLALQVVARGLSVRETEALVKAARARAAAPRVARAEKDADTKALEADLTAALRLPVKIEHRGEEGGELRLRYRSLEELDGLCRLLSQ